MCISDVQLDLVQIGGRFGMRHQVIDALLFVYLLNALVERRLRT